MHCLVFEMNVPDQYWMFDIGQRYSLSKSQIKVQMTFLAAIYMTFCGGLSLLVTCLFFIMLLFKAQGKRKFVIADSFEEIGMKLA